MRRGGALAVSLSAASCSERARRPAAPCLRGGGYSGGARPSPSHAHSSPATTSSRPPTSARRAITIRAPADEVWPWIAQLGQGRGGFYSYDFLENLIGCDIRSAERVVPEWQDIAVGDTVNLYPEGPLDVAALEMGRSLVIRGGVPMGAVPPPYDFTWAFVLREEPGGATRLLVRERYAYTRRWAPFVVEPAAALSFVMTQKMLRGIRDRAERDRAK